MITLKDFMDVVDHKITEGSHYGWQCYGPDAYRLDSWNQVQEGHTVSIVFDTRTHAVYEASAYDYKNIRAYRLINPDHKEAFETEAMNRGVEANEAWDECRYVDLETEEDFLEKARAIVKGEDYDTRVQVDIDLPDDVLFQMMKLAHERDITFNKLVEIALQEAIDQHKMLNDDMRDEYDFDTIQGPVEESVKKIKKHKKGKM